ncbi:MAG: Sec-independent protein translocase protein TatB [Pseudomonadota bacterium]
MELSWSELLVVAVVALVIIGPKDLPGMFRELGRFTAKLRAMGREFNRAMEAAAKESGVQDVADDLRKVANPKAMGLDTVRSAADKFEKWDPLKNAAKPTKPLTPAPMPPSPPAAAAQTAVAAAPVAPAPGAAEAAKAGPNTAALYEKRAARKAVADEAAARLRAISVAETPVPEAKKPGRRRKKPEVPGGDDA